MKTFTLLFMMVLGFTNAFNQDYYPMVQENNEWNVLEVSYPGTGNPWDTIYSTITYKFTGDTIINDTIYKKVLISEEGIPTNWEFYGAIREDENNKVWFYPTIGMIEERLMYDFSVNVGDTIENYATVMVVDSIAYKEINGEDRKHIYFSYIDFSPFKEIWIEGIGSNRGVLQSGTAGMMGGWTWFLCMSENGELVYMNPNYNSCYLISTDVKETSYPEINIFPNPANNILIVENLSHTLVKSIKLVDLKGNIIKEFSTDQENLNLNGIKPGSYILMLKTENGTVKKKIIVN
ncbi:MAG: T9SS type A sorting domain-containing protein [Chlorobi bacterium]|nr:T9SS type A sorting domain-containing protein [Chlorobiota bacterium]